MDDHTAFVELLAELEGMGKAPIYLGSQMVGFWVGDTEAERAIRVAAEDMLDEWASAREGEITRRIDPPGSRVPAKVRIFNGIACIGTGPTIAVALLNAVRTVRGMKEKA